MAKNAERLMLQANTQFAIKLYKLLADKEENVFFSPISVHTVLSMVHQGAKGPSADQLADVLQIPDMETAREGYKALLQRFDHIVDVTITLANRIFLTDGAKLLDEYNTAISNNFMAGVELVNFAEKEATANRINEWVKEQTKDKIPTMVSQNTLDESVGLVLINAIYFEGKWQQPFKKEYTKTEKFYLNDTDTVDVEMMKSAFCSFPKTQNETLGAWIFEMPYGVGDLSMIVFLPWKVDGIYEMEENLSQVDLIQLLDIPSTYKSSEISFPKFKIEKTMDLKESLIKLGLGEIFSTDTADLSGTVENENLAVGQVLQKAFIEVDEEGSVAGAATLATEMFICAPDEFICDHPFMFFIVQKSPIITPLFVGKFVRP